MGKRKLPRTSLGFGVRVAKQKRDRGKHWWNSYETVAQQQRKQKETVRERKQQAAATTAQNTINRAVALQFPFPLAPQSRQREWFNKHENCMTTSCNVLPALLSALPVARLNAKYAHKFQIIKKPKTKKETPLRKQLVCRRGPPVSIVLQLT